MTTLEMQILFETLLQTGSSLYKDVEKPDTYDIFLYLNQAQTKFINDRYLSAPDYFTRSLQISANYEEVKELLRTITLTTGGTAPYTNTKLFSTDVNILHFIGINGLTTRTYPSAFTTQLTDFKRIEGVEVNKYLTTPINIPIVLIPVYVTKYSATDENDVLVIHDKYTTAITTVKAQCLVEPDLLVLESPGSGETTTCQLAPHLHESIVYLAVQLFEAAKYKLKSSDND